MLWGLDLTRRAKVFLWQVCMNRLFTQERALKLGKGDGCCKSCLGTIEDLEQIFYNCFHDQWSWASNAIFYFEDPTRSSLVDSTLFIDILDSALGKNSKDRKSLHHSSNMLDSMETQNGRLYSNQQLQFSPRVSVEQTQEHLEAAHKYCTSYKKKRRLKTTLFFITPFGEPTIEPR